MRHLIAAEITARALNAGPGRQATPSPKTLTESYRRVADVFHDILSEHSLDNLLERIADTLAELVPHDSLSIYQADEAQTVLTPVLARDKWAEKIMSNHCDFGEGISGWAALHRKPVRTNQAHLDPRVKIVPGTPPDEPEALVTVPCSRARRSRACSTSIASARRRASTTTSSSSPRDSPTRPRSRSTTPRSARSSSTRPRPTR